MQVFGFLIIFNPEVDYRVYAVDSTKSIDRFLFWSHGETEGCLSQLTSLIECDANGEIRILHASLRDFLCDPTRSHQFYLCRESVLSNIALLGLRHMSFDQIDRKGVLPPIP